MKLESESESPSSVVRLLYTNQLAAARAIRHYLNETLDIEARQGATVLGGLEYGPLFQEQTERVAQHWLMQEPSAALQWLVNTGLDDATRMRLLSAPGLTLPSLF
jgi:hypothetical protein